MIGPGDMSELALGFTTYGATTLSMYGVNAGLPKTIQLIVAEPRRTRTTKPAGSTAGHPGHPHRPELIPGRGQHPAKDGGHPGPYILDKLFPLSPADTPPGAGELLEKALAALCRGV